MSTQIELPDTFRAIGLWQPYASGIAHGLKSIETRHWATEYRGWLAIHATLKRTYRREIYNPIVRPSFERVGIADHRRLPFGCFVAVCILRDCVPVEKVRDTLDPVEHALGGYSDGRFAWILSDVIRLEKPVPARGRQCWWSVTKKELGL
jgi:activating signal cointegrator 1